MTGTADLESDMSRVPVITVEILASCHALVFVENKLVCLSSLCGWLNLVVVFTPCYGIELELNEVACHSSIFFLELFFPLEICVLCFIVFLM